MSTQMRSSIMRTARSLPYRGILCPGGSLSGVSLSGEVSVQGVSLSRAGVRGVQGSLSRKVSVQGRSLSRGGLSPGRSLSRGVSVMETPSEQNHRHV